MPEGEAGTDPIRRRLPSGPGAAAGIAVVILAAVPIWLTLGRGEYGVAACVLGLAAVALAALGRGRGAGTRAASPLAFAPNEAHDLVRANPDPVIALDPRAVVTAANGAARTIIPGLRVDQPLSFALRAPEVLDAIREVVATGEPRSVEYGGRAVTEPTFEVRLRPLPFRPGPGSPRDAAPGTSAVVLFFRDLSAERRLETMRVDFIATVSHELRTPLASLAGFIDTLKGPARNDPAARERFLDIMRAQANRMARLVDDLLQLSRVELNAHLAPVTPLDLGPLVGHMVEIMAPLAREREVAVALAIEPGPLLVPGDRDELLRLVENLVENAVKYGGSGGRVEVSLKRQEDRRWIELAVQDHGPGIAPEHLPRVTERFYRVDVAESRQQGGTGLGLAIVKHIVGRHRGRLSIESEPGRGALFRVLLPAVPQPET